MKLWKIIISFLLLVATCLIISFGVYSILYKEKPINNNVTYKLNSNKCFVEITGEYDGPSLTQGLSDSYYAKYDQNSLAHGEPTSLPLWTLGPVNLTEEETSFSIKFTIKNLDVASSLNIIELTVSDIAYHNIDGENKQFETTCKINDTETNLNSEKNSKVASINKISLSSQQTIEIVLNYKLLVINKKLDFRNDVKLTFALNETN